MYFPVKLAKFLRAPISEENLQKADSVTYTVLNHKQK